MNLDKLITKPLKDRRLTSITIEDLVPKLVEKYKLPEKTILAICRHQFHYTNDVMREGKFESVRLMHLGIFGINKFRVPYIPEHIIEMVKAKGGYLNINYPDKQKRGRKKKDQNK